MLKQEIFYLLLTARMKGLICTMLTRSKKIIALLLVSLLLFSIPACQAEESAAQTAPPEAEKKVLRILTDIDCLSRSPHANTGRLKTSQASKGEKSLASILRYFGDLPNGVKVKLETLSTDSDRYEAELTRTRVEIMSGGGPDLFLMSGFGGCDPLLPESTLFLNPERAAASGFFLQLDSYIADASFMNTDNLNSSIMEAGRYRGKQYILPVYYRIPCGFLYPTLDEGSAPATLDEMLAEGSEEAKRAYADNIFSVGFRGLFFDQIADNLTGELLISEDELFQRTKEAIQLYQSIPAENAIPPGNWMAVHTVPPYDRTELNLWYDSGNEDTVFAAHDPCTYFVPKGPSGRITASIETWCAVNRNTQHPDEAFFVADILLSRNFQRMDKFWTKFKKTSRDSRPDTVGLFWMASLGCLPVDTSIAYGMGLHASTLFKETEQVLQEAQKSIGYAFFTSDLDRELDDMFYEFIQRIEAGEEITDEAIRNRTDRCWMTLKMMLG